MLALLAGMAVFQAVASHPLGEDATVTEGRVLAPHQSPTLPTYHVGMLYPEGWLAVSSGWQSAQEQRGLPFDSGTASYPLVEHDPGYALALDPWVPTYPLAAPSPSAPVQAASGALSEEQLRAVLTEAGWPAELHGEALAIIHCESRGRPGALGDGGASAGLFQLNIATWFRYARENPDLWADPLVNARTAWATYNYDIGRGYVPWKQWSCKP